MDTATTAAATAPATTAKSQDIITMEDGRELAFSAKRKMQKETEITAAGEVITRLSFRNGRVIIFTIPQDMILRFAGHGAEQKLGDAIAGLDEVDDCILSVEKVIDHVNQGDWNAIRKGGDSMAGTSILARALSEVMGKPLDMIQTFLSGKTHAEKIALRGNARVRPVVERLESEKKNKGKVQVDTDALLGELAAA